jgi:hypothetical protein
MASLLADENFAEPVTLILRTLGHDIETMAELGWTNKGISDATVLQYAAQTQRILLTFNRKDFIRLHQENSNHAGIIVCTIDPNFKALAERIHILLENTSNLSGQLLRINRPNP